MYSRWWNASYLGVARLIPKNPIVGGIPLQWYRSRYGTPVAFLRAKYTVWDSDDILVLDQPIWFTHGVVTGGYVQLRWGSNIMVDPSQQVGSWQANLSDLPVTRIISNDLNAARAALGKNLRNEQLYQLLHSRTDWVLTASKS